MTLVTQEDGVTRVEVLPCPWCGSTDLYPVDHKRIHCRTCDALGPSPVDTKEFINHNDAIARWNARPDGERIAKAVAYLNGAGAYGEMSIKLRAILEGK